MGKYDIDLSRLASQFRNLDIKQIGNWPVIPRTVSLLFIFAAVVGLGWYLYWKPLIETRAAAVAQEQQLRAQYLEKAQAAVNLDELRRQRQEVAQFVTALERQLPSQAEMDALLSDINQAGVGRGLQFQLFRPSNVELRQHYAEQPIVLQLTGSYHDFGAFAADIAALPRIVTLGNISLTLDQRGEQLTLDTVARTFRYLSPEEQAAQAAAARQAAAGNQRR